MFWTIFLVLELGLRCEAETSHIPISSYNDRINCEYGLARLTAKFPELLHGDVLLRCIKTDEPALSSVQMLDHGAEFKGTCPLSTP